MVFSRTVERVLFSSSDRKKVDGFLSAIQELNEELNFVVAVRTMEMTQQARFESVDISKLQQHSADIERLLPVDGQPWALEETVIHHIAQIIRRQFTNESGEHDVLRAVKIVLRTQDNLDDENRQVYSYFGRTEQIKRNSMTYRALFDIKYQFELERINRKLDYWGTRLLEELRKGPHSLIPDGDLKGRPNPHSYYIDTLYNRSLENAASAICDAIDKDASGYISASEVAEFLQTRPTERDAAGVLKPICSVPEWLAYCAYGWDADNILYPLFYFSSTCALQARENFDRIRELKGKENNPPRTYVKRVAKQFDLVTKSLFRIFQDLPPEALLQMERLRDRRRAVVNDKIALNLQKLNYRLDQASSVVAIAGDERLEWTFYPLLRLLTSTHLDMFERNEMKNPRLDSAIGTLLVLFDAFDIRVTELKRIWRRQGLDINRQMRYYANGMFAGLLSILYQPFSSTPLHPHSIVPYATPIQHYSPKPQLGDSSATIDKTVAGIEDLGMGDLAHTDADISQTRSRLALACGLEERWNLDV
ncbi:hypothetical protein CVT26_009732 [Gymnopilus dilepis]|uniref:EF-hand domain-containing protein n=1 Tax=Gymnopilus dilepis TaxID=231916 RepID=A0A409WCP5_9AGAR|nr:hypothetical protein CVT26_009732 [Gymnopilus dilepis]